MGHLFLPYCGYIEHIIQVFEVLKWKNLRKDGFPPIFKINYEPAWKTWGIDDGFVFMALEYFKQFNN
jgi:hypothetical protein